MTLFTSLGPSADCRGLTQVTKYQGRTNNARAATFWFRSVVSRWAEVYRVKSRELPTRVKEAGGTVCPDGLVMAPHNVRHQISVLQTV